MRSPAAAAMRVSLAAGLLMLAAKVGAWLLTGSSAIFSDAAESVVHVMAVAFAAFSVSLSERPAGRRSPYGFERIAFFSAGFEGLVIVGVAALIIWAAIDKWRHGIVIEHIGAGILITLGAGVVNGLLGWWLIRRGRSANSMIVEADGQHVLTDSWTSMGAVAGLGLVVLTGWKPFDPLFAIATAVNILWTGGCLVWRAAAGLMDIADEALVRSVHATLDRFGLQLGVEYHDVQVRDTGRRVLITVHLLFPYGTPIGEAHARATELESEVAAALGRPAEVTTHLEAIEDHAKVHSALR